VGNDLADYEVIKEHFNGRQVLLDRLRRILMLFNPGRETSKNLVAAFSPGGRMAGEHRQSQDPASL
jgi:hypothetical protein